MLKLSVFELITRALPESFLLIWGINILCNVKLDKKKYIFCSISLSVFEFIVRELPINYGVHTILNLFFMILIISKVYKIGIIISIKAAMISTILLFICEALNMIMLNLIFNNNLQNLISNQMTKILCGIPSLIIYLLILIFIIYRKRGICDEVYK